MDSESRLRATKYIWGAGLLSLFVVNGGVIFNAASLDWVSLAAIGIVAFVMMIGTGMVWNWGSVPMIQNPQSDQDRGKSKRRERIEGMLDLLSDAEIEALRQRLADSDGQYDDELMLTDDGELVQRNY